MLNNGVPPHIDNTRKAIIDLHEILRDHQKVLEGLTRHDTLHIEQTDTTIKSLEGLVEALNKTNKKLIDLEVQIQLVKEGCNYLSTIVFKEKSSWTSRIFSRRQKK